MPSTCLRATCWADLPTGQCHGKQTTKDKRWKVGGLFLIRLNNPVRSRHLSSKHLLNVNTEFTYRCSTTLRAHCNCDAFSQANQPPPPLPPPPAHSRHAGSGSADLGRAKVSALTMRLPSDHTWRSQVTRGRGVCGRPMRI